MTRTIEGRSERRAVVEHRRDRLRQVREAGFPKISLISVIAGILAAYGAFVLFLGIAAAVLEAIGVDSAEISNNDWRNLGTGAAAAVAVVLFVAYLFGGYIAGRMARRAGIAHGVAVFVLGILVAVAVAAVAQAQDHTEGVIDHLDSLGIPTEGDEWAEIASVAGIGALVGIIVGAVLGGVMGERWHQRLARRALDPSIGPEADVGKRQERLEKQERRLAKKRERHEDHDEDRDEDRGALATERTETDDQADDQTDDQIDDQDDGRHRRGSRLAFWKKRDRGDEHGRQPTGRPDSRDDVDLTTAERADDAPPPRAPLSLEEERQQSR